MTDNNLQLDAVQQRGQCELICLRHQQRQSMELPDVISCSGDQLFNHRRGLHSHPSPVAGVRYEKQHYDVNASGKSRGHMIILRIFISTSNPTSDHGSSRREPWRKLPTRQADTSKKPDGVDRKPSSSLYNSHQFQSRRFDIASSVDTLMMTGAPWALTQPEPMSLQDQLIRTHAWAS